MEKVLFTGGSGYLGSAVLERLTRTGKYNVIAVSSRKYHKMVAGGGNGKLLTF